MLHRMFRSVSSRYHHVRKMQLQLVLFALYIYIISKEFKWHIRGCDQLHEQLQRNARVRLVASGSLARTAQSWTIENLLVIAKYV